MPSESTDRSYQCPYPDCDWTPSRPVDTDNGLTRCVVDREIQKHRCEHTGETYDPLEGVEDAE